MTKYHTAENKKRLIAYRGETETLLIAMEETAELAQAISKWYRAKNEKERVKARFQLVEEISDVRIAIDTVMELAGIRPSYIERMMEKKMERNVKRIREERNLETSEKKR